MAIQDPRLNAASMNGKHRGMALVLVIGIMFILMALGTGTLYCGLQNRVLAVHDSEQIVAKAAADAGLKKAVSAMNSHVSGPPLPSATNEALPGCAASYSYAVTQNPDHTYSATSTGTSGTATRTVGGKLKSSSSLWSAVSLNADVSLASNSQIRPRAGSSLKLQTNSVASKKVSLKSNAVIQGDVAVGPGGNPATVIDLGGGQITGTTSAAQQALSLPAVVPPTGLPDSGDEQISGSEVISSDKRCSSLTLQGAQVQIQGDVTLYVTGNVTIKSSSQLLVRDGSRLTLYVGGTFSLKGGVIKEVNLRPEKLQIYGTPTCTSIDFSSSTTAYTAIYAPAAQCSLGSSSKLVGVFSGKSLALASSSTLYYDASVDGQCLFGTTTYSIDRWWEN
jgi:Tfp pilus assembly protein PilX